MPLKGIDVSKWQQPSKVNYSKYDFIMIRSSTGAGSKDPQMDNHAMNAISKGKLIGFYHFAYPQKNKPEAEADGFIAAIKNYLGEAILALDYEAGGFKIADPDAWAMEFCNRVYQKTGVKPLIYVQQSKCHLFKKTCAAGYGLWIAHWTSAKQPGNIAPWKVWTMWQWTSNNETLDEDIFNGDVAAWRKYAAVKQEKASNAMYYTIKRGDTLSTIAKKYGTTWQALKKINNIKNANIIQAGQRIRVK